MKNRYQPCIKYPACCLCITVWVFTRPTLQFLTQSTVEALLQMFRLKFKLIWMWLFSHFKMKREPETVLVTCQSTQTMRLKAWLRNNLWHSIHQEWDNWRTNFGIPFINNEITEGQTLTLTSWRMRWLLSWDGCMTKPWHWMRWLKDKILTFSASRMRWLKDKPWHSLHQRWDVWMSNFDIHFIKNDMTEWQCFDNCFIKNETTDGQTLTFASSRMRRQKDKLWHLLHQEWDGWRTNFDIPFTKNEMTEGQTLPFTSPRMRWLKDKLWHSLQEWDDWRTNYDIHLIKNEITQGQTLTFT